MQTRKDKTMQEENEINLNDLTREEGKSTENESPKDHPEVIEVDWEDAQVVIAYRDELHSTQTGFSNFLLQVEKRKAALMSRCEILEKEMYKSAEDLQEKYSVSSEVTYELKLPSQEGEKGYFIKKED